MSTKNTESGDDIDVDVTENDGILTVTTHRERQFQGLDGEPTDAPVKSAEIRMPADEEVAEAVGCALLGWYAEQQPTGPPGQKPMHQQYAEMEPDR
jgi:hypothetical protein